MALDNMVPSMVPSDLLTLGTLIDFVNCYFEALFYTHARYILMYLSFW